MNLAQILEVYAGGAGSGCKPEVAEANGNKCGRQGKEDEPLREKSDDDDPEKPRGTTDIQQQTPIRVNSIEEAIARMEKGEVIEFGETHQVHTLIDKLAEMAREAKAAGKEAKNYDLCQVTVQNTNIFCTEHQGLTRIEMPQFGGEPEPGSPADKLPKDKDGNVDGTKAFVSYLESRGISVTKKRITVSHLRATQRELIGNKVAGMMTEGGARKGGAIFTSQDNYVLDGHHRWAALLGLDARDDKLGDLKMMTLQINSPISELLHIANHWIGEFGIKSKGTSNNKAKAAKK